MIGGWPDSPCAGGGTVLGRVDHLHDAAISGHRPKYCQAAQVGVFLINGAPCSNAQLSGHQLRFTAIYRAPAAHQKVGICLWKCPDLQHVIQYVRDSQAWDFTTKDGLCAYHNACVYALSTNDPEFGHLVKNEGQNHCTDPAGRLSRNRRRAVPSDWGRSLTSSRVQATESRRPVTTSSGCLGRLANIPRRPGSRRSRTPTTAAAAGRPRPRPAAATVPPEVQAQLDRIEAYCLDQKLFLSNINDQINLMATVVNDLRADQNPQYSGTLPRQGNTLQLNPQPK